MKTKMFDQRFKLVEGEFVLGNTQELKQDPIARLLDEDIDNFCYVIEYKVSSCEGNLNYFLCFTRFHLTEDGEMTGAIDTLDIDIEGPVGINLNIKKTFTLSSLLEERVCTYYGCQENDEITFSTVEGWLIAIALMETEDVDIEFRTDTMGSQLIIEVTIGDYNEDIYIPSNIPVMWTPLIEHMTEKQEQINREMYEIELAQV